MHLWANNHFHRSILWLLAAVLWATPAAPAAAENLGGVQVATESAPAVVSSLLEQGRSLEADGRWGDALAHYEEALRDHPSDRSLRMRFDLARLHYSLERRYSDRSFRESVSGLTAAQALDLYSELLLKVNTHFFDTPPWAELAYRGVRAMEIALADETFRTNNALRTGGQQIDQLRREMRQTVSRRTYRTRHDAVQAANEIARLAAARVGLSPSATLLEFASAAAGGLDNYSSFLTSDQLRDVYSQIEGNFVGLGVELKADEGALLIVHVIPGSPAERSEIRAGDRIVAVDGRATSELSTDEAAALLTGVEGSYVRVTTVSSGGASRTVSVRREHVEVPSLEDVQIIDSEHGVAYIRIPAFQKTTAADLEKALWELHGQGMRSLVLDLRGNPGGLLTASVEVADKFVVDGAIVSTRGRSHDEDFDYRAHRAGTWRVPLVVLIDGDSASASEIFAAAIKDSHRGTIVGGRSFGKGSVQGIFPLGYGGAGIRLTTAKFYSPMGRPISNVGVDPDIDVRRATLATAGAKSGEATTHEVGLRGVASSNNLAAGAKVAPRERETRKSPAKEDAALSLAIQTARTQPAAQL